MASSKVWSGRETPTGSSAFSGTRSACAATLWPNGCFRSWSPPPREHAGSPSRNSSPGPTALRIYESEHGGIMISLAGKAALITGGSRGIGAAAVKLFAQAGADVVFSYNSAKEAARQVEQEAAKHGTRVEAFRADVGKHEENRKIVEHCINRLGRLGIL